MDLSAADVVTVVLPAREPDMLFIEVAVGEDAERLRAMTYPSAGTVSAVAIETGRPMLIGDVSQDGQLAVHMADVLPIGPVMAVPLVGQGRARGALLVGRIAGKRTFTESDLEMTATFANHAAVALELTDARADQQRVALLEERDRIARDLHDHVIQRLFADGLSLQSIASAAPGDEPAGRLLHVVDDLDDTIRQIRNSIFQLRGPLGPSAGALRATVLAVTNDLSEALGFAPDVTFVGPVDTAVDDVVDDVAAVAREALTNVERHAKASRVDVTITVSDATLAVHVLDNGVGIGAPRKSSGLVNMRHRAVARGGELAVTERNGTYLRWTIPLA